MDNAVITTIISTSGAAIVGLGGMWISTNQIGNRIGDLARRMDRLEDDMKSLYKAMTALEIDVALLNDKAGL